MEGLLETLKEAAVACAGWFNMIYFYIILGILLIVWSVLKLRTLSRYRSIDSVLIDELGRYQKAAAEKGVSERDRLTEYPELLLKNKNYISWVIWKYVCTHKDFSNILASLTFKEYCRVSQCRRIRTFSILLFLLAIWVGFVSYGKETEFESITGGLFSTASISALIVPAVIMAALLVINVILFLYRRNINKFKSDLIKGMYDSATAFFEPLNSHYEEFTQIVVTGVKIPPKHRHQIKTRILKEGLTLRSELFPPKSDKKAAKAERKKQKQESKRKEPETNEQNNLSAEGPEPQVTAPDTVVAEGQTQEQTTNKVENHDSLVIEIVEEEIKERKRKKKKNELAEENAELKTQAIKGDQEIKEELAESAETEPNHFDVPPEKTDIDSLKNASPKSDEENAVDVMQKDEATEPLESENMISETDYSEAATETVEDASQDESNIQNILNEFTEGDPEQLQMNTEIKENTDPEQIEMDALNDIPKVETDELTTVDENNSQQTENPNFAQEDSENKSDTSEQGNSEQTAELDGAARVSEPNTENIQTVVSAQENHEPELQTVPQENTETQDEMTEEEKQVNEKTASFMKAMQKAAECQETENAQEKPAKASQRKIKLKKQTEETTVNEEIRPQLQIEHVADEPEEVIRPKTYSSDYEVVQVAAKPETVVHVVVSQEQPPAKNVDVEVVQVKPELQAVSVEVLRDDESELFKSVSVASGNKSLQSQKPSTSKVQFDADLLDCPPSSISDILPKPKSNRDGT